MNLTKGYIYKAAVRAVNLDMTDVSLDLKGLGGGAWQDDDSQGVQVLGIPSQPFNFSIRPRGNKMIMITWGLPDDTGTGLSHTYDLNELGYEIQFNTSEFVSTQLISRSILLYHASIYDYGFDAQDIISGKIRALNAVGNSIWSSLSTSLVLKLPGTPSLVNFSYVGEEQCLIGCVGTKIFYSASFEAPFETGLGFSSSLELLKSFQIRTVCLICIENLVLSPTQIFAIQPDSPVQKIFSLIIPLTKVPVCILCIYELCGTCSSFYLNRL